MASQNPYASPADDAELTQVRGAGGLRIASQGKRFLNMIIDGVILSIVGFAYGFLYAIFFSPPVVQSIENFDWGNWAFQMVLGYAINVGLYVFMEGLFQKTPAKFLTGTRVVNVTGGKPSLGQIVGRSFARMIPFEPFSFFGGQGYPVGWHDSLSGTRVVTDR